jgi:hypothetical protein
MGNFLQSLADGIAAARKPVLAAVNGYAVSSVYFLLDIRTVQICLILARRWLRTRNDVRCDLRWATDES